MVFALYLTFNEYFIAGVFLFWIVVLSQLENCIEWHVIMQQSEINSCVELKINDLDDLWFTFWKCASQCAQLALKMGKLQSVKFLIVFMFMVLFIHIFHDFMVIPASLACYSYHSLSAKFSWYTMDPVSRKLWKKTNNVLGVMDLPIYLDYLQIISSISTDFASLLNWIINQF